MIRPILFLVAVLLVFGVCRAFAGGADEAINKNKTCGSINDVISYVLAYRKNLDCLKELEKHRKDREEVTRIEKWIERQNPRIPSATRRGYAEFTVENGWPVLEDAKR